MQGALAFISPNRDKKCQPKGNVRKLYRSNSSLRKLLSAINRILLCFLSKEFASIYARCYKTCLEELFSAWATMSYRPSTFLMFLLPRYRHVKQLFQQMLLSKKCFFHTNAQCKSLLWWFCLLLLHIHFIALQNYKKMLSWFCFA